MALFNSTSWTGREIPQRNASHESNSGGGGVATVDAPPRVYPSRVDTAPKIKPRVDRNTMNEDNIAEYRRVAKEVGISDQDMLVEEFRLFLARKDWPVFNLLEVVSYMDDLTAKDNPTKLGWHWCPVRAKDAKTPMTFGRPSIDDYGRSMKQASSDFYQSHRFNEWQNFGRGGFVTTLGAGNVPTPPDWRTMQSAAYTRTLPLHALKKVATIEREFKGGDVVFLVTDYTVAPHVVINPDPFLMAVIPNSAVAHGKGRFIIDVWDEPGFGIERMLK